MKLEEEPYHVVIVHTVQLILFADLIIVIQGFMKDKIIASHTCFGGHMRLTVKPVYKLLNVSDDLKWTTNTHVTPFSL